MLANDPDNVRHIEDGASLPIDARSEAESSAERKWGPDWQSKRLDAHFAELIARDADAAPSKTPVGDPRFDWWHILLTAPNREAKAAKRLEKANIPIYLPNFTRQVACRGHGRVARLCAVIPGMLFAPRQIMGIKRRDETLEWAGVRDFMAGCDGLPALVGKADIELIRVMEAKLNLPPEAKGVLFKLNQRVRFKNELYSAFWGTGTIFEIASEARIGLWVEKLFGAAGKVYVPASEIEAM